jgi:hypothetical protein
VITSWTTSRATSYGGSARLARNTLSSWLAPYADPPSGAASQHPVAQQHQPIPRLQYQPLHLTDRGRVQPERQVGVQPDRLDPAAADPPGQRVSGQSVGAELRPPYAVSPGA